jgi:transcriptional regulator with XRE-family HTH domain
VGVEKGLPNRLLQALGQRIRELRTEQGYSQEGFADKCGVHRTFMGTVERGESNLSFENIAKVSTTLGIPLSALFIDLEAKAQITAGHGDHKVKARQRAAKARTAKNAARSRG